MAVPLPASIRPVHGLSCDMSTARYGDADEAARIGLALSPRRFITTPAVIHLRSSHSHALAYMQATRVQATQVGHGP